MHRFIARFLVVVTVALSGVACQTAPKVDPLPVMTFSHLEPFSFSVSRFDIERAAPPDYGANSLEASAPVTPFAALGLWARERLQATGGAGQGRVVVRAASLKEMPLPTTGGIKGAFINEQSVRYAAELEVELHLMLDGGDVAMVTAEARRSRTAPENATLNDRRRIQYELVEALMADFDQEMATSIRDHLARWLR